MAVLVKAIIQGKNRNIKIGRRVELPLFVGDIVTELKFQKKEKYINI